MGFDIPQMQEKIRSLFGMLFIFFELLVLNTADKSIFHTETDRNDRGKQNML